MSNKIGTAGISEAEYEMLQDRIKKLEIENKSLRKELLIERKAKNVPERRSPRLQKKTAMSATTGLQPNVSSSSPMMMSCSCSGNCSTKRCGCSRKERKCSIACKCNATSCVNQEENVTTDENNSNNIEVAKGTKTSTPKSRPVKKNIRNITKHNTGLFSSVDTQGYQDSYIEEQEVTESPYLQSKGTRQKGKSRDSKRNKLKTNIPININSDEEEIMHTKTTGTHPAAAQEHINNVKESVSPTRIDTDNNEGTEIDSENLALNPMVPQNELSRTPTRPSNYESDTTECFIASPQPIKISNERKMFEDLCPPEVDWEQHQKELVSCKKCNRKLFPHRIEKHEKYCKRV